MPDPPSPEPLKAENLEFLKKQAKALLRAARSREPAALSRLAEVTSFHHAESFSLAQAQLAIARQAGFASWPKLQDELHWRERVRQQHRLGTAAPHIGEELMSSQESLKLGHIDQIGLGCTDLDAAEEFYCGVLGLRLAAEAPNIKLFDCDGVNIIMFKGEYVPPNSIVYFRIPGQPGLIERNVHMLKGKGVKVETDAHVIARNWNGRDVWLAFFRDPFGNLLALKSDVPA